MYSRNVKEIVERLTTKEKNKFIEESLSLGKQHPNDKTLGKHQREHLRAILIEDGDE